MDTKEKEVEKTEEEETCFTQKEVKPVSPVKKNKIRIRLEIRKMSMSAMFVAISFILSLLTYGIPKMPQGGSVSLEGLGIVISGLYLGPIYGFVVGMCYSLVNLLMDGALYHWASLFLDYIIPFGLIGLMGGIFSKFYYKNKIWSFFVAVVLGFLCKYIASSFSGVLLFPQYAGDMNVYYYSFIFYNLPYNAASLGLVAAVGGALYIPLQRLTKQISASLK